MWNTGAIHTRNSAFDHRLPREIAMEAEQNCATTADTWSGFNWPVRVPAAKRTTGAAVRRPRRNPEHQSSGSLSRRRSTQNDRSDEDVFMDLGYRSPVDSKEPHKTSQTQNVSFQKDAPRQHADRHTSSDHTNKTRTNKRKSDTVDHVVEDANTPGAASVSSSDVSQRLQNVDALTVNFDNWRFVKDISMSNPIDTEWQRSLEEEGAWQQSSQYMLSNGRQWGMQALRREAHNELVKAQEALAQTRVRSRTRRTAHHTDSFHPTEETSAASKGLEYSEPSLNIMDHDEVDGHTESSLHTSSELSCDSGDDGDVSSDYENPACPGLLPRECQPALCSDNSVSPRTQGTQGTQGTHGTRGTSGTSGTRGTRSAQSAPRAPHLPIQRDAPPGSPPGSPPESPPGSPPGPPPGRLDRSTPQHNPRVDHVLTDQWNQCAAAVSTLQEKDKSFRCMTTTYSAYTTDQRSTSIPVGLAYFEQGMQMLDSFSLTRSADQRRFHDAIMVTMAPHILKEDYLFLREEILKRFKLQAQNMATLILCPRRWGKSTSVAMALAVLMRICRGVNIVIFSTGEDSTSTLLQMTKDFFLQLPGSKERITINRRNMIATLPADMDSTVNVNAADNRSRMLCNVILARSGNVIGPPTHAFWFVCVLLGLVWVWLLVVWVSSLVCYASVYLWRCAAGRCLWSLSVAISVRVRLCARTHPHTHMHTDTHAYIHTQTHTDTHIRAHTHPRTPACTYANTPVEASVSTHVGTLATTHLYIHIYTRFDQPYPHRHGFVSWMNHAETSTYMIHFILNGLLHFDRYKPKREKGKGKREKGKGKREKGKGKGKRETGNGERGS